MKNDAEPNGALGRRQAGSETARVMQQLDRLKPGNGRHDWIRTSDLFRVKEAL